MRYCVTFFNSLKHFQELFHRIGSVVTHAYRIHEDIFLSSALLERLTLFISVFCAALWHKDGCERHQDAERMVCICSTLNLQHEKS